jgi:hypothetical protein
MEAPRKFPSVVVRGLKAALGAGATRHEWRSAPASFKTPRLEVPSSGFEPPITGRSLAGTCAEVP